MKMKKIVILLVVCICIVSCLPIKSLATPPKIDPNITTIMDDMDVNKVEAKVINDSRIVGVLNAVVRLIQIAGTGISVLIVTILGIKYMFASSSDKADIKKMAMPIIIGCVLLFGAVNLVAAVAGIGAAL